MRFGFICNLDDDWKDPSLPFSFLEEFYFVSRDLTWSDLYVVNGRN